MTGVEHGVEETVETFLVRTHHIGKTCRHGGGEIRTKHTADRIRAEAHARLGSRGRQPADQALGAGRETFIKPGCARQLQRHDTGGHRHRTARQRARLIHRTQRRDVLHDVAPSAKSAHRHAAADHLAQRGQIWSDAIQPLHALRADAKARHHLIENQHRAVLCAHAPQGLEEARLRLDQVHVARHRLDDDGGNLAAARLEHLFDLLQVVEIDHDRVLGKIGRHTARGRVAESQQTRARLHQQAVGVTVIATLELEDGVAPGKATRQPDRAHRRLGARTDQTHHLHGGQQLADQLCHHHLALVGRAKRQALQGRLTHRFDDRRVGMTGDRRPP